MKQIGKFTKVELRELWIGEATDFTPWLALEDNIAHLGEAIGIELEIVGEERRVGPFRADILCKDTLSDKYVLIENQLERTDHGHLGQLMTYAAGLNAVTIVWIAKTFSDEHRAAMDWLNNITDDKINFFGIEIEVYKIGDSLPAPMFQIVAKPNDWSKSIRSSPTTLGELTPTKQMNLEYWEAMKKFFESTGTFLRPQKPSPQHWTNFAVGRSYFHFSATMSVRDNFIRIELIIDGNEAKNNFFQLKNKYEEEANNLFDNQLIWEELPDAKVSSIYIKKSANTSARSEWQEQHEWFRENLEKMDKFFRPKIKEL
jgi:hypothetical protein